MGSRMLPAPRHRHLSACSVVRASLHFKLSMVVCTVLLIYPQTTLPWPGDSVFSRKLRSHQCLSYSKLKLEEGENHKNY